MGRPSTTWMKNIHDDLSSLDLGIHEARDLAQNRPLWRLVVLHAATGLETFSSFAQTNSKQHIHIHPFNGLLSRTTRASQ